MNKGIKGLSSIFLFVFLGFLTEASSLVEISKIQLECDDQANCLRIFIDGQKKLVYQYHPSWDLPHYWPLKSPSGKNLLVQKAEPYPHHRSFWFADTVQLEGERKASFYNALYSGQKKRENTYKPPFLDHVQHIRFTCLEAKGNRAVIKDELLWEMDGHIPVLDERRELILIALGQGEYFMDIQFILTASYGEVKFLSDDVHYAWPYLRMHPCFSGENGGIITSDHGTKGQENTNMKYALWIDYSNTVEGITEGLAVFQWPYGTERRWLTREYGTFGPRRPDNKSGQPFTLKKGENITQRVGIWVHRGGVKTGRVKKWYHKYIRQEG